MENTKAVEQHDTEMLLLNANRLRCLIAVGFSGARFVAGFSILILIVPSLIIHFILKFCSTQQADPMTGILIEEKDTMHHCRTISAIASIEIADGVSDCIYYVFVYKFVNRFRF